MFLFAEIDAPMSIFETIAGQPFFVSLLLVSSILFMVYSILEKFGLSALSRILVLVPLMLIMAVFYFQHGPLVATLLLSAGFLLSFVLAFAQLMGGK